MGAKEWPWLGAGSAVYQISMPFYAPAMTMAGALSVTPVRPSVRTYLHTCTSVTNNVHSLSWLLLIRILWNLVTLFSTMMSSSMFDNGPYLTMLSVVMALCLWKFTIWKDVHSLSGIFLIRMLWNLVTLFSTMMSSSSSIMVHIAPCFQYSVVMALCLWKNHHLKRYPLSKSNIFDQNFMKLGHNV